MDFHPGKCNVLSISRKTKPTDHKYKLHDQILEHVISEKISHITSNLNWSDNIITSVARPIRHAQCFLITPVFKHQFHIHEGKCIQIINQVFTGVCLTCWGQLHPERHPNSRNSTMTFIKLCRQQIIVDSMIQHSRWQSLEKRSGMA